MNIYLPIISNIIIALILIAGIFVGRKNGWKLELIKLLVLVGSVVGLYFLNPIIASSLANIEFCKTIISLSSEVTFKSLCLSTEFIIIYSIISIIILIIRKNCRKIKTAKIEKINSAKSIKSRKERRKEAKQFKKLHTKQISKKSKIIGSILGLVVSLVLGYVLITPIKYGTKDIIASNQDLKCVETAYEYTIYGQLDKLTNFDLIK